MPADRTALTALRVIVNDHLAGKPAGLRAHGLIDAIEIALSARAIADAEGGTGGALLAAYQQSLRAQHPTAHAPGGCPCREGCDYQPVAWSRFPHCTRPHGVHLHATDALPGTNCADCDPRLAPDAALPPEVAAACGAAGSARADAAALDAALRRARADALRTAADAVSAFARIAPDRAGAYLRLLANAADEGLDIAEHAARLRRMADEAESAP